MRTPTPALVAKLEEFAGAGEIHLNLADVQYCDLAGLRAMILPGRCRPVPAAAAAATAGRLCCTKSRRGCRPC